MLYYYTQNIAIKNCIALALFFCATTMAHADVKVLASIKPIHSLVAAVMQSVGTPELLLNGSSSPHTYALKPSDAGKISGADLIFWIGPDLEGFLTKPLDTLSGPEKSVPLLSADKVVALPPRDGANFASDGDHETVDPHVWLSPDNAIAMLDTIANTLSRVDPVNSEHYRANAERERQAITALKQRLQAQLAPLHGKGFIVFHDAYQYFEESFALQAKGAIAIHPENPPSAGTLAKLRGMVQSSKAICVFSEPQFDPKLVTVLTDGTTARAGILDPLGAAVEPGPVLYITVMEALATSFAGCLSS